MRTTIDVDRNFASGAAKVLGTTSLKDTVNAALREVVGAGRRRKLSQRVRSGRLSTPTTDELSRLRAAAIPVGTLGRKRRLP